MPVKNDATRYVVRSTDPGWFSFLSARRPREVNFWIPSAGPVAVVPGTPWFYQIRGTPHIAGCGFFAAYSKMPLLMAWETFGEANGAATYAEFMKIIAKLRDAPTSGISEIGCAALVDPIYFSQPVPYTRMYGPMVSHDTREPESARLWQALTEAMHGAFADVPRPADTAISQLSLPGGRGAPTLIRPRLGQSAFRTAVLAAYERRCVVTGERTLPVLQAAHIRPFADLNEHDVRNGLLMRSDLHVLFDAGLVTVDPNLRFRVSPKIREMYENGRDYYALNDRSIRSPRSHDERPLREHLEYHSSVIFKP